MPEFGFCHGIPPCRRLGAKMNHSLNQRASVNPALCLVTDRCISAPNYDLIRQIRCVFRRPGAKEKSRLSLVEPAQS
jgi:hypothetical protein